jgi:hypothetical protein
MGNMDLMKKKTLFDVLKKNWHSKRQTIIMTMSWHFAFLIGLYFNRALKKNSIISYQPFLHLLVEGLNIHIHLLLFSISKNSFCFGTYDKTRSWFLLR